MPHPSSGLTPKEEAERLSFEQHTTVLMWVHFFGPLCTVVCMFIICWSQGSKKKYSLQYSLALLKGQPFSHCCCCLLFTASTQHNTQVTHVTFAICWENIILHYRARIVTTCHLVPKIWAIKEWVHFLDPSVYEVGTTENKVFTWEFLRCTLTWTN
jgi:hypothetical protein